MKPMPLDAALTTCGLRAAFGSFSKAKKAVEVSCATGGGPVLEFTSKVDRTVFDEVFHVGPADFSFGLVILDGHKGRIGVVYETRKGVVRLCSVQADDWAAITVDEAERWANAPG